MSGHVTNIRTQCVPRDLTAGACSAPGPGMATPGSAAEAALAAPTAIRADAATMASVARRGGRTLRDLGQREPTSARAVMNVRSARTGATLKRDRHKWTVVRGGRLRLGRQQSHTRPDLPDWR